MASPRTRRILQDLRPTNENTVSEPINATDRCEIMNLLLQPILTFEYLEMFRMWHS